MGQPSCRRRLGAFSPQVTAGLLLLPEAPLVLEEKRAGFLSSSVVRWERKNSGQTQMCGTLVTARATLHKLTSLPAQRYRPLPPTHPGPILRASPLAPLAVRGTQGALTFLLLDTSWVVASGPDQTARGRAWRQQERGARFLGGRKEQGRR